MKIELAYVICQPFQPVVLLLSFHVATTGEDNQTDDPLLEIAFLYSASVGPSFPLMLYTTLSGHPVQCTRGTQ